MNLQHRIELLQKLSNYLQENNEEWQEIKQFATAKNGWFVAEFIDQSVHNICTYFLSLEKLNNWVNHYFIDDNIRPKNIGIVMAGNIPLVGFHDFLCAFVVGHRQTIKLSSKDDVLLKHIFDKMESWNIEFKKYVLITDLLKNCDAYIATGSNNSSRYFEQYFNKYPHIIRRNRTSVGILSGKETKQELMNLSDDIHLYFGLGCRNITKIFVPKNYDFVPLLAAFDQYKYFIDHHKYKNNYDYQLSIALMNNVFYMTNGSTLLIENDSIFSAISQLYYSFYDDVNMVYQSLQTNKDVQAIAGLNGKDFGLLQAPQLFDYADGVDTMQFLISL